MSSLLLFNPENDLALATDATRYTPPAAAWHLHLAGEILPLWYASPGDRIVCQGVNDKWLTDICSAFNINDIDVFNHSYSPTLLPMPWGWSRATKTNFLDAGVPEDVLPNDEVISRIRDLSHRRTAAQLAKELSFSSVISSELTNKRLAPPATEITKISELEKTLKENPALIIKAPWSSSGRGVFDSTTMSATKFLNVASDIIRRYGSVMAEEKYSDITDFALLFHCNDGICKPWGYSTFLTSPDGRYIGNLLLPEPTQRRILSDLAGMDIDILSDAVAESLTRIIGNDYSGYLGVDMLTGTDKNGMTILDAAVEINLRMTMGIVAANIARRFISKNALAAGNATFSVKPTSKNATKSPSIIDDGLLRKGTFSLTPPNPWFDFIVNIP